MHRSTRRWGVRDGATMAAVAMILCLATLASFLPGTARSHVETGAQDRQLESELSWYLSGLDGRYGLAAISLDGGPSAFVNAGEAFPTASMYKLLVMYRVFQAIERGDLTPYETVTIEVEDATQSEPGGGFVPGDSPTIANALRAMITVSSNAAAYALVRKVGGWPVVHSAPRELGMNSTASRDGFLWSTPGDLARFFHLLAHRSLVSPRSSEQMIRLLLDQTQEDRLPALLPAAAAVAHKTGELDTARNDGGIVYGPRASYVLVVMAREGTPEEECQVEAALSRIVFDRYENGAASSGRGDLYRPTRSEGNSGPQSR